MPRALITGITGQDGSILARFLLDKGYKVHGIVRRTSTAGRERLLGIEDQVKIWEGDLLDQNCLNRILQKVQPDEIYNLAAQSHVHTSFEQPEFTAEVTGLGVLRMLEATRSFDHHASPRYPRFYQASSSELFGDVQDSPQTEKTEIRPRSPYGCAKAYGHYLVKVYRESYGMHASCGILFNHESETRGLNFVTRKITHHVAKQAMGITTDPLELGNMDAERDWGHAQDYVEAMWLMLQQDKPDEYVIATGETHTVREFVAAAYKTVGVVLHKNGNGVDEQLFSYQGEPTPAADGNTYKPEIFHSNSRAPLVKVNPKFYRPADVETLMGDPSKAEKILGWKRKVSFQDLVTRMVLNDIALLEP